MLSFSFVDTFLDKLLPVRGKGSPLVKMNTSQNLMSNGNDILQSLTHEYHRDLIERDWIISDNLESQASNPDVLISNIFPWLMGNNVPRQIPKLAFSPHLTTIVQNSLRFILDQSEMLECINYLSCGPNILCDTVCVNPIQKNVKIEQYISGASESSTAIEIDCKSSMPLTEDKITQGNKSFASSLCEINTDNNKQAMSVKNCNFSVELANRKAKELHKRSKKRRRRQKKVQVNLSLQNPANCHSLGPKSSHGSDIPSATSNISHSKVPNHLNKLVSQPRTKVRDTDFTLDIVHMKGGKTEVVEVVFPGASSFVVSVANTSDEDSDWDTSTDNDWFPESNEFELSGLFVTNLNAPRYDHFSRCNAVSECIVAFNCDDFDELNELQAVLCEVNKNWEEATKGIDKKPKLPSKVSFAPDDELVEVMPVETYERKGEWEMYAIERIRFRRRIDELEKVLSPCLSETHRLKIYQQLHNSEL